jgi:flagellar hook-basal body complex protein FliE
VHDVMLAEVESDMSFRMLLQTRNKLVEAYKEIMRMQI